MLSWADISQLLAVHKKRRDGEVHRWAISHAAFHNAHFRAKDSPVWIPEDFLGGADRQKRGVELQIERQHIAMENQRLAQIKRGAAIAGGGTVRIVDGVVHATGVPDMFRLIAEEHQAKQAAIQDTIKQRAISGPFGGKKNG